MKKTLLILLLMATARAHESPVAAPTAAPVSQLTEAEQKKIFEEAKATYYDEENYSRALELFHQLAAVGHAEAMESIGLMYERGHGVARDYASAQRWYEKAIAAGNSDGYWRISWLYRKGGPGIEQNHASAKWWAEKVIAAGNRNGYMLIGSLYEEGGPGLKRNYASAKRWYEKTIAAGSRLGYVLIGSLYEEGGPGLKQDLEQACRYYQKADSDWQEKAEKVCSR